MSQLLRVAEAAKKLGVHPGTLANWRAWGTGPKFTRQGRTIVYKAAEIEKFAKALTADRP
ncbi:MAG TPA: helix-turn-helix domain-containing protein [Burkholderiales bacterium]|nr:helix-turn-helix domain-containing protein [Burkholderiales bacterium]